MTYEQQHTTVQRDLRQPVRPADELPAQPEVVARQVVEQQDRTVYRPSGSTVAARIVAVVFGIVQALLLVRILLEGLGAIHSNQVVAAVLDLTQLFVGPFEGMFRINSLSSGASVIDTAAITALIGITLVEMLLIGIIRIPRHSERV